MTRYDHIDEEQEMKRLRSILKNSEEHLKQSSVEDEKLSQSRNKRKRESKNQQEDENGKNEMDLQSSLLSDELLNESGNYSTENPLIVLPKKKKKKSKKLIQLTPEEIREAKALQKKTAKKLLQLEARAAQKKRRAELYKTLEKHQVSKGALSLLSSSGKVSRKETSTKKQTLQNLLNRERAGIALNQEEKDLLYPEVVVEEETLNEQKSIASPLPQNMEDSNGEKKENEKKKKGKRSKRQERKFRGLENESKEMNNMNHDAEKKGDKSNESADESKYEEKEKPEKEIAAPPSGMDFAAQMMASFNKLKADTTKKTGEDTSAESENEGEHEDAKSKKRYIPTNPTVLKTAASMSINAALLDSTRKVMSIKRPSLVEKNRYDLPVSAMEFEIMDSIRNNDVTIICGETGSGKSTQVPQFLYEGGVCLSVSDQNKSFLIGVTQPRRVAAVSTAKRVCFEVGMGDGQSIKGYGKGGNLVSYRTRYESAGTGSKTRIQFMTDGILLQQIQSDLLLRRYSVIVLDEAHERNLNTDVLIGLLSKTIPLRKKAAEEESSIVPLKLVLMSATLRVEDFTKNESLFPSGVPSVVKVPGRTFPVSIHHSKVTEVDDYGE
jgi:ATP-dependent RNA helicase DHX37/DHR1